MYCDADGTLRRVLSEDRSTRLESVGRQSRLKTNYVPGDALGSSPLRKISLTRLERHLERRIAENKPLSEEMRNLAGIYRIRYVLVYPDEHDIVLAGPAGNWREDAEGRRLNVETGQPVLQLDDLVVVMRSTVFARWRSIRLFDYADAGRAGSDQGVY